MNDRGFDTQLRAWMEAAAEAPAPTRIFDQVLEATASTRQLRRWPSWPPAHALDIRSRPLIVLVAIVLLIALLAGVIVAGSSLRVTTDRPAPTLETVTADVFATTCAHPATIETAADQVWVACADQVRRYDRAGAVNGALPASAVAVDAAGAWVAAGRGVRPIDAAVGPSGAVVDAPGTSAIALDPGSAWALDATDARIVRVDRATGRILATVQLPGRAAGLVTASGRVWVALPDLGRVAVVDPVTNSVTDLVVAPRPLAIASAFGAVWVLSGVPVMVTRLDPATLRTQSKGYPPLDALGRSAIATMAIAADDRSLWITAGSWFANIDPGSLSLVRILALQAPKPVAIAGIAPLGGQLLILDSIGDRILEITR